MSGETKTLKTDLKKVPAPQYLNPDIDDYEYAHGSDGAIYFKEQTLRGFTYVPLHTNFGGGGNVKLTNMTMARVGATLDSFSYASSSTAGATLMFKFWGKRIGIYTTRANGFGKLTFEIDGMAFETLDTDDDDGTFYNVPHIIALDLPDTEHTLTVVKLNAANTAISGFMVDAASQPINFVRAGRDLFANNMLDPIDIGTTDTTISTSDTIAENIIITNTTATAIIVTLKATFGNPPVGPFEVPPNDFRPVPGPVYFHGGMKAIADAVGCRLTMSGQF